MRRRNLAALVGLTFLGTSVGGAVRAEPTVDARVVFDELHPGAGVRVKAIVANVRQLGASEFDLRIQLWDENDDLDPSGAPTVHLIAPDDSVALRQLWWLNTYDEATGNPTLAAIGNRMSGPVPTAPESTTRGLARLLRDDYAEFVWVDAGVGYAAEEGEPIDEPSILRAVHRENDFDIYTIPGSLYDVGGALGYEYVIPLRVEGGQFSARVVAHGFGWRPAGETGKASALDVPVAVDLRFRLGSPTSVGSYRPAAPRALEPGEVGHAGVIVRMKVDDPARKPYLRCDVFLQYPPGITADAAAKMAELAGSQGKRLIMEGLLRDMATAEEIEADQLFHMERARKAIREVIIEAGFPAPLRVLFSSWVIQG